LSDIFIHMIFFNVYIATFFFSTRSIENEDIKENTVWTTKIVTKKDG